MTRADKILRAAWCFIGACVLLQWFCFFMAYIVM